MNLIESAIEIIAYLNARTGRQFRARKPNGDPSEMATWIIRRLKEKYTVDDWKLVIEDRIKLWSNDDRMSQYITPETLSRHFERYLAQAQPKMPVQELPPSTKDEQPKEVDIAPEDAREAYQQHRDKLKMIVGGRR